MSGKTSFSQLLYKRLCKTDEYTNVVFLTMLNRRGEFDKIWESDVKCSFDHFLNNAKKTKSIIIIDEAQKMYKPYSLTPNKKELLVSAHSFWEALKQIKSWFPSLRVILLASYGYESSELYYTPLEIPTSLSIDDIVFTNDEFEQYMQKLFNILEANNSAECKTTADQLKEYIRVRIGTHPGVLASTKEYLIDTFKDHRKTKPIHFDKILNALMVKNFVNFIQEKRCCLLFSKLVKNPRGLEICKKVLLSLKNIQIDDLQDEDDEIECKKLINYGILVVKDRILKFPAPIFAEVFQLFLSGIIERATVTPNDLQALITSSFKNIPLDELNSSFSNLVNKDVPIERNWQNYFFLGAFQSK
jgi:hypothetical protein